MNDAERDALLQERGDLDRLSSYARSVKADRLPSWLIDMLLGSVRPD